MPSRYYTQGILWVSFGVWAAVLLLNGVGVSWKWTSYMGTVVGAVILLTGAFEYLALRLPYLDHILPVPSLYGTWQTIIESDWVDPATQSRVPPIPAFIIIHQTFSTISIRLITKESASEQLAGRLVRSADDGICTVVGLYRNTPRIEHRQKSPIHHGALLLQVHGKPVESLEGYYWTDRGNRGSLRLLKRNRQCFHSFAAAERAFDTQPHGSP
jgi:hypothetical protein